MDSAVATVLTSSGIAGVFVLLLILGWVVPKGVVDDLKAEREALKDQAVSERERADAATAAAQASRDMMAAVPAALQLALPGLLQTILPGLVKEAMEKALSDRPPDLREVAQREYPELRNGGSGT